VSSGNGRSWRLDEASDAKVNAWLEAVPDPIAREQFLEWLAKLVHYPLGRGKEDQGGVFHQTIPNLKIVVSWVLDLDSMLIHLLDLPLPGSVE
jgi:hypothetical protein